MQVLETINKKGTSYFEIDSANVLVYIPGIRPAAGASNTMKTTVQAVDTNSLLPVEHDVSCAVGHDVKQGAVGGIVQDIERASGVGIYSYNPLANGNNQEGGTPLDHAIVYTCGQST